VEFHFNNCIVLNRLSQSSDLKKGFAAELRRRRMANGISQERLAELADLHRTYISAVESGRRNPTLESIQRLATALGASVGSFFTSVEGTKQGAPAVHNMRQRESATKAGGILLVEDDPRDVEFTMAAFRASKLANPVEVATDGEAALEILSKLASNSNPGSRLPQLILLDLHLPKVHGLEVLRRIKADPRLAHIPIVVLTASRSDRDIQEATRLGANAYLIKPVDFRNFAEITPKLRFQWMLL